MKLQINSTRGSIPLLFISAAITLLALSWYLQNILSPELFVSGSKRHTVSTDIDLDGISDLLVYSEGATRPTWFAYSMSGVDSATKTQNSHYGKIYSYQVGAASSIPVEGDYNGDGLLDLATYTSGDIADWQQNCGIWRIYLSTLKSGHIEPSGKIIERRWGGAHEVPMPGDFDGDGKLDLATYSPTTSVWRILFSRSDWDVAKAQAQILGSSVKMVWGKPKDMPLLADFDGDGRTDIATYRAPVDEEKLGTWSVYYLPVELRLQKSKQRPSRIIHFGDKGSIPVPADYNCDGAYEISSYNPSNKEWSILNSGKSIKTTWLIEEGYPLTGDFDGDSCADLAFFISRKVEDPSHIHWVMVSSSLAGKGLDKLDPKQGILTRIPWRPMSGLPTQMARAKFATSQ